MAGFDGETIAGAQRLQRIVEEFRQRARGGVDQAGQEQGCQPAGALQKYRVAERLVGRKKRLQQVHVRVLAARQGGRQAFQIADARMREGAAEQCLERQGAGAQRGWRQNRCGGGQGQQHKGMVVEIQRGVDRAVAEIEEPRVAAAGQSGMAGEEIDAEGGGRVGAVHAVPASIGEHPRLARGDPQPAERRVAGVVVGLQEFDEAAGGVVDALRQP